MTNPRVNVLIANHNYGEWIMDAVNSAIEQTYPNIAITIVDDFSSDDSWQRLHHNIFKSRNHSKILPHKYDIKTCEYEYNGRKIPITAIRLDKNYGPSFARNVGISSTIEHSDYYQILDADDKMYANKVWRCLETAMQLPDMIGIVYADYMTLNTENGLERIEYKENFELHRLYQECIIHSGALVSKKALIFANTETGFYDINMRVCEDYDLWLRITKSFTAVHIPECLTLVRVTPKNSSNTVKQETWMQHMQYLRNKMGQHA